MAHLFKCDICYKDMGRKDGHILRFKNVEHVCSECITGIEITIVLMRRGPFLKTLQEYYFNIVKNKYEQGSNKHVNIGRQKRTGDDPN